MAALVSGSVSQKELTHEAFPLNEQISQAEKEDFSQENKGFSQMREFLPFRDDGVQTRETFPLGKDAVLVSKRVSKTREDIAFRKGMSQKTIPPYVPQTLPDTPMEKAIRVKAHTGSTYCYAPTFVDGESYIYLDTCSASDVKPARYDVFQRVVWNVKDVWLCMTAPGSVTGVDGSGKAQWDYVKLRPCVTNDPNQRWIINGRSFYTADGKYRVKDVKWYAYISKNAKDYYNHTLVLEMDSWIKTIAAPGNMSLHISVGWKHVTSTGFNMYYLSDNGSKSDVISLYYNPENGHIARYFPSAGILSCMVSKQSSKDNWDWVVWKLCKDTVSSAKDAGYWDISYLSGREGPLQDRNGNYLRVTQYGVNWGMPYTAKGKYLEGDTKNSPTSEFVLPYDFEKWSRYVYGNLGDSLTYCPAPGHKNKVAAIQSKAKKKLFLPPNFELNDEWRWLLYAITSTTDRSETLVGMCGICLMQTYQMIAELQEYYPSWPPAEGYFFVPIAGTNPITAFRQRYPDLARVMENIRLRATIPLLVGTMTGRMRLYRAAARAVHSTTQAILPRFRWTLSPLATNQTEIRNAIQRLLDAQPGTMWIAIINYVSTGGRLSSHAVPVIRAQSGLIVIPTNSSMISFADFSRLTQATTDINTIMQLLGEQSPVTIFSFSTLQLSGEEEAPLSVVMSQNNCTGEGNDRRGNRQPPRSSLVNQCVSGRCSVM
ncbi:DUF1561 domain-containing protein [Bartonella sp. F2]|nr:DUF1561 domain-containing protein [Bartonella sp. F02]